MSEVPSKEAGSAGNEGAGDGPGRPAREHDTKQDPQLANIRHSLRTPLNQIIGYSEMLQEAAGDLDLADRLADLHKIRAAGGQLLVLVNENLTATRIASGRLDLEALQRDCRTLLNLIVGYSELCEEEATAAEAEVLRADLAKVRTAAGNLLALLNDGEFLRPLRWAAQQDVQPPPGENPKSPKSVASRRSSKSASPGSPGGLLGTLLVVDDNEMNRDMLFRRLEKQGHRVLAAENGRVALERVRQEKVDLLLLDIIMPEFDGMRTLAALKADEGLRHIPVIMLSAMDEMDGVVRCVEMGADDYLTKPYNPVLLTARITACLEKKRLRDQEQAYLEQLRTEREKSEGLLLNILPKSVADRLKEGETTIADSHPNVTVMFVDLVDFTRLAGNTAPRELVEMLNEIFSQFDWLAELHRLEKIKTIGDAYMVAGGLPLPRPDHAQAVAEMALDMRTVVSRLNARTRLAFEVRIGISSGPVVAGIIGSKKFIYDLWGDTVNIASRMESHGQVGAIQVSQTTHDLLRDQYAFQARGPVEIKGKGLMSTYLLTGRR